MMCAEIYQKKKNIYVSDDKNVGLVSSIEKKKKKKISHKY